MGERLCPKCEGPAHTEPEPGAGLLAPFHANVVICDRTDDPVENCPGERRTSDRRTPAREPDGERIAFASLQEIAHGIFEGADPRQGMPGWEEDDDPMTSEKGWVDVPEGHAWYRQMVVDYIWAAKDDKNPPDESEIVGVALIGTPAGTTETDDA